MSDFYKNLVGRYLVLSTYSHTDTRELLKVVTRPIMDLTSADIHAEMANDKAPKGKETFIVKIVTANDAEHELNNALTDAWHKGYNECKRRIDAGERYDFSKC